MPKKIVNPTEKKTIIKAVKKRIVINATSLNLTLSQSSYKSSEDVIKLLVDNEGDHLRDYACVKESHKDNTGIHYHVYIRWTKMRELSLKHFNYLGKGIHVEKTKNREFLLAYMTKEAQPVANFDFWSDLLNSKDTFPRTLVRMVVDYGFELADIQLRYRAQIANKPWISVSKFAQEVNSTMKEARIVYHPLRFIDQSMISTRLTKTQKKLFDSNPCYQDLIDAINEIKPFGNDHPLKSCCVSLVGEPSIGKTTFLQALSHFYRTYHFPVDGWHFKHYKNAYYSIWIWEEWSLDVIPFEELLLLTEGLPVDLRIKGSKTQKLDRPMLFLSNNETFDNKIQRKYKHIYSASFISLRIKALQTRIKELNFGSNSVFWLINLLVPETEDICPKVNPLKVQCI